MGINNYLRRRSPCRILRRKLQRIIDPVVYFIASSVVILLFLISANPGPRGTPAKFTVMTFNILAAKLTNGSDGWEQRKMAVVKMLRKYEPNVIGTQEVTKEQLQFLLAEFPHYRAVGAFRDDSENPESVSVFYDTRVLGLLKSGDFWLSETPEIRGSKSWFSAMPQMCTWVKLRHLGSREEFYLFNTHLDYVSREAQIKGASLIAERMQAEGGKTANLILTGDLNSFKYESPWNILTGKAVGSRAVTQLDMKDAWMTAEEKRNDIDKTFHESMSVANLGYNGGDHIDYVLYRPADDGNVWRTKFAMIVMDYDDENYVYPSDHYPVLVEFSINEPKNSSTSQTNTGSSAAISQNKTSLEDEINLFGGKL